MTRNLEILIFSRIFVFLAVKMSVNCERGKNGNFYNGKSSFFPIDKLNNVDDEKRMAITCHSKKYGPLLASCKVL